MAIWRCSTARGYRIIDLNSMTLTRGVSKIDWDLAQMERGGFPHFMLKEIFEQPQTVEQHAGGPLAPRRQRRPSSRGTNLTDEESAGDRQHRDHGLRHELALGR